MRLRRHLLTLFASFAFFAGTSSAPAATGLKDLSLLGTNAVLSGATFTINSGATFTVSGTFAGTPTGGTLNLSNTTLTLPATVSGGTSSLQPLDAELTAIAALSTNGLIARTGAGTAAARTLTGTSGQITVTNGDGVAGNPTVALPATISQATTFSAGTTSTSSTTGTVVISGTGGLGVGGAVFAGGTVTAGAAGGDNLFGNSLANNSITVSRITSGASSIALQAFTNAPVINYSGASGYMVFQKGSSEKLRLSPNDNLLVGTAIDAATSNGILAIGPIASNGATAGLGYATGAGGTITQGTSRTTGVTLNKVCGAITLFTAAGSATATSFTVTNSTVAATDVVRLSVASATNKYLAFVTATGAGSFEITFYTTGGTASDAPVINFAVFKSVTS